MQLFDKTPPSFELTDETKINNHNTKLYRIRAVRDIQIPDLVISKGTLGGWVESMYLSNGTLRLQDNAWVMDEAEVWDNAQLSGWSGAFGFAQISGNAKVIQNAGIGGFASVSKDTLIAGTSTVVGHSIIQHSARIMGNSHISDEAKIGGQTIILDSAVYEEVHIIGYGLVQDSNISGQGSLRGAMTVTDSRLILENDEVLHDAVFTRFNSSK